MAGPLGTATNSPTVDPGTMALTSTPAPGPAGAKATAAPRPAQEPDVISGGDEPEYHPGVMHNHQPKGRWAEIQKDPQTSNWKVAAACLMSPSPWAMAQWARIELRDKPIAMEHYQYYLDGKGGIFEEDKNIENWISTDTGVQARLVSKFPRKRSGVFTGKFEMEQEDYDDEDFKDAFGGIDQVDFTVDFSKGTIQVWFMDRYEWHPAYRGITDVMKGDVIRGSNALHYALVEMKKDGAADYWMRGQAKVQLSVVLAGAAKHSSNDD